MHRPRLARTVQQERDIEASRRPSRPRRGASTPTAARLDDASICRNRTCKGPVSAGSCMLCGAPSPA